MLQPRRAVARAALAAACGATLVPIAGALTGASPAGATVVVADDLRGAGTVSVAQQALSALQHADQFPYSVLRQRLAALLAPAAGLDPRQLDEVWRVADPRRMVTVLTALTQLGTPYHGYQRRPGQGFDCSGFTSWVWAQAGVQLPRISRSQIRSVAPRTAATAQAGDLAYYPGHVMLYLGIVDAMVHAPQTGPDVSVDFIGKHHQRSAQFGNPLG